MTPDLHIRVAGVPAPQGSKRHVGGGIMIEASKRLRPWRDLVHQTATIAAKQARWETATGPIDIALRFYMPRPKSHYGTGRNVRRLKPSAPEWPTVRNGDLDKLARAIFDSLTTAKVIADDSQIVRASLEKDYAPFTRPPGVDIDIYDLEATVETR